MLFLQQRNRDEQGGFIIRDPNSEESSNKSWVLSKLMGQMANLWAVRASRAEGHLRAGN